jgi:hypothetical protein
MKLMSQQKRVALKTLDESSSPFGATTTQRVFKNVANLQLRGNTYDAKHLDSFLNSDYGDKSFNPNRVDIARKTNGSPLEEI